MRKYLVLMTATALTACGGVQGPQTAGGAAVGAGTGGTPPGGGTGGGGTTGDGHSFVTPTVSKVYQGQAGTQSYRYTYTEAVRYDKVPASDSSGNPIVDGQGNRVFAIDPNSRTLLDAYQNNQLYQASASTVRSPGITVTYDPRNAQFTLVIAQNGLTDNITFQDPAHRTDFSGARRPQLGVPNLETGDPATRRTRGVQYLEVDSGSDGETYDVSTFFYELPGTTTKYVTYAGFVRNHFDKPAETLVADAPRSQVTDLTRGTALERVAFVFGEATPTAAVPRTGTGTFNGNLIASMVNTPQLDTNPGQSSYFQWLSGTANVAVDFGSGNVTTTLAGTTLAPMFDPTPIRTPTNSAGFPFDGVAIPAGATFAASSTARIDLATTGGFVGTFGSASFTSGGVTTSLAIAGSTLDGAFYGPAAEEVGGSFRIVGGIPDQRVDIIGAFTGKKN